MLLDTMEPPDKKKKMGRPLKPLEELAAQKKPRNFNLRTNEILGPILEFMARPENNNMSLKMLLARLGRREFLNPFSDHNNYDDGHMFSRIINNEDLFKAPNIDALDGVVLKVA